MKSWKIGAIAGLIAGIFRGVAQTIAILIGSKIGLPYYFMPAPPETPIIFITMREISIAIIWGIILGVIYSKIYDKIPGAYIKRGIYYGLALFLIFSIRTAIIAGPYISIAETVSWIFYGVFGWLAYGIVLGILFEFLHSRHHPPRKRIRIRDYDIGSGLTSGAIAGLVFGLIISLTNIFTNIWIYKYHPMTVTLSFLTLQSIFHIGVNTFYGIFFGVMFAMFYDRVPYQGIKKGLVYGLIVYLITSFQVAFYGIVNTWYDFAIAWSYSAFLAFIAYGLVLGAIYKPPK